MRRSDGSHGTRLNLAKLTELNPNKTTFDFIKSSSNLFLDENGIWRASHQTNVAYPEEGNELCFQIEENSYWFAHRNACILAALSRFPPTDVFLDIGGGNGYVSLGVQSAGYPVVLLEPGIRGAINAKNRGIHQIICSTLQDANLADESISAVGLFDVIEHISDDDSFLRLVHGVMKPEGRLYLTTPSYTWLWSAEDDFAQHFRRFTTTKLEQKLQHCGYRNLFATYIFAFLPIPIFIFRTLPYLLKRKNVITNGKPESDHRLPGGFAGTVIERILQAELKRIRKGKKIPFGGSCLLVCEKV